MFLDVSGGDIGFARAAALETVNAYRTRNAADLVSIAQIVAFDLAALGSLSLSMADNLSLSVTLRLRGNANALNRSAEHNRRALQDNHTAIARSDQAARWAEPAIHAAAGDPLDEATPPAAVQPAAANVQPRPHPQSGIVSPAYRITGTTRSG
jgi:hypothetical protein